VSAGVPDVGRRFEMMPVRVRSNLRDEPPLSSYEFTSESVYYKTVKEKHTEPLSSSDPTFSLIALAAAEKRLNTTTIKNRA
jgi:hypothetical protein